MFVSDSKAETATGRSARSAWYWSRVTRAERIASPIARLVADLREAGEDTARLYAEAARLNLIRTASILAVAGERLEPARARTIAEDVVDDLLKDWIGEEGGTLQ